MIAPSREFTAKYTCHYHLLVRELQNGPNRDMRSKPIMGLQEKVA